MENDGTRDDGAGGQRTADGTGHAPHELPRKVRHDLRSGIGQVIGYSELWLDEITEANGVEDVEALRRDLLRIKAAGEQILAIVNEHIDPIHPHHCFEDGASPTTPAATPAPDSASLPTEPLPSMGGTSVAFPPSGV